MKQERRKLGTAVTSPVRSGAGLLAWLLLRLLQRRLQFLGRFFNSLRHNRIRFGLSLLRFLSDFLHIGERLVQRLLNDFGRIGRSVGRSGGKLLRDALEVIEGPAKDLDLFISKRFHAAECDAVRGREGFDVFYARVQNGLHVESGKLVLLEHRGKLTERVAVLGLRHVPLPKICSRSRKRRRSSGVEGGAQRSFDSTG